MDNNHELRQLSEKRKSDRKPLMRKNYGVDVCPYCKGSCSVTHRIMNDVRIYWVLCDDLSCHYEGASFETEGDAIERHNQISVAISFSELVRDHFEIH